MSGTDVAVPESTEIRVPDDVEAREDVSELVRLAITEKVPVEVLERLVALQERVMERDARAAFFAALNAFQEECPEIAKVKEAEITTKGGSTYSYTFAPLPEITRTIRPVLKKHGLSYSWTTDPSENPGVLNVVCILRHVEGHEERAVFPVPTQTNAAMSAAQKNGAALTYGRRQSLEAVLGLTTSDDVDGANPPEPLSEDQIEEINNLVTRSGADFQKFLAWVGVESLADMTKDQFPKAKRALQQKVKEETGDDPVVEEAYDRVQRVYQKLLNASGDAVTQEDAERIDALYEDQDLEGLIQEHESLRNLYADVASEAQELPL